MARKKKLTEIYGLSEGPFDDINKQLAGATSVAADPRAKRTQAGGSDKFADVNKQLGTAKSVAREALGNDVEVTLSGDEAEALAKAAETAQGASPALASAALKVRKAMGGGGSTSSSSSMSAGRSIGGLKLQ